MRLTKQALAVAAAALLLISGMVGIANAEWPDGKPITVVIQYKAGGGTDTMPRAYAKPMEKFLNATINAVNRPGALGSLAMDFVA
jgi:tripartite-type tricarboxylate transporter receptor subunit TctC